MVETTVQEGWGFPANSRKAHYFDGAMSLCRKWMFAGNLEIGMNDHPENCIQCQRKLAAREKSKQGEPDRRAN